ncbi:acyltransferase family protein [Nocardioides currus]|uniref:Acyltransferase n=1 Tax=Nocardioides currus TaxID=2133958 RepID=A0A2R7Z321_9ACTN|nr:acyltransferase [Nocardioides currus]PUA83000.1 acyltransferase [Nocardioides currus]
MTTLTQTPPASAAAPADGTPTDGTPTDGTDRRMFPLNALRAVAALSVVVFHAYQYSRSGPDVRWPWEGLPHQLMIGTEMFVEMFFVLSGLVLWLPVARAIATDQETRSGRAMLLRRTARLLPLYWTVVLVVWALSNPSLPGHWQDLLLHLTFTHVYSDQYIFWTDGPAWTLAVEFHFYLLVALSFPVFRWARSRWPGSRTRLACLLGLPVLLLTVGLVYNLTTIHLTSPDPTNWSVWFSPMSRASSFAVGMLLAVVSAYGVRLATVPRRLVATAGVVTLLALVLLRPETGAVGHWWPTLYAAAMCVALASIVLHDGPWARGLSEPTLVWIGGLGYGIYLVHEPVMRVASAWGLLPEAQPGSVFLVTAVVVAVPAVVLAWLSSRTVEAAGLRVATLVDRNGVARDYYPHLPRD